MIDELQQIINRAEDIQAGTTDEDVVGELEDIKGIAMELISCVESGRCCPPRNGGMEWKGKL
jgi:hypothetical protein